PPIGSIPGPIDMRFAISGYEVHERLGEGGMGVVYRAMHQRLRRWVALKWMRAGRHATDGERRRFLMEAEAFARLRHPNVVQIYDLGEAEGLPWVALELLEGGSLRQRLNGVPHDPQSAAGLLVTLLQAMQAAHHAGIVHRDLKPSNILFDLDGTPKIVDFGLAKSMGSDSGLTDSEAIVGTPSYMAPEQAKGQIKEVGPEADIFA